MQYYSTNHQSPNVKFAEAMMRSEAADGGLYMPERLPVLPKAYINNIQWMTLKDISFVITNTLFGDDMPSHKLKQICDDVATYPMPLIEIEPGIYAMELFHGPTKTVKDFGTMMLTRILHELLGVRQMPLNVMVETTGNSGNAIATCFNDMEGINVYVLYPKGLPKQFFDHINGLGHNIHPIEVAGTIDDCREMINKAFSDPELCESMMFTSANSLNLGCLLPSTIPYFNAYAQLKAKKEHPGDIYVSVPCGNCGTLLAGYIAKKMGLPITRLIGACNENAGFHNFITTNTNDKKRSKRTHAYGMDMAYTVNAPRFLELCKGDLARLREDIVSEVCTDAEISQTIKSVYADTGYLLDPHSAVSYMALKRQLPKGASGIFLATSHPVKSADILTRIGEGHFKMQYKFGMKNYCARPEAVIPPRYGALKKLLKFHDDQREAQRFA